LNKRATVEANGNTKECEIFGHWLLDNDVCVKCEKELDLENDGYVRIFIDT